MAEQTPRTEHPAGPGRLLAGVAWAALLLGLWGWGADGFAGTSAPMTGDVAAVGRPMERRPRPPARAVSPPSRAGWTCRPWAWRHRSSRAAWT